SASKPSSVNDNAVAVNEVAPVNDKPESAEAVWTDEQCLQFAAVAFRHAPKNLPDGVTLEDIRMAASTVYGLTASPRPEASGGYDDDVVCLECGQPIMYMGQVCYACSHPTPHQ